MREFDELLGHRRREVDKHLVFIRDMYDAALNKARGAPSDMEHINILKSAFLVHLYNVIESVMTKAIDDVAATAKLHPPPDWAEKLFRAWLSHRAGAVVELAPDDRIDRIVSVIAEAAGRRTVGSTRVARGESGNWSHLEIETMAGRLGCPLDIRPDVNYLACERHFLNEMAPMKYVRHMRNQLAHGNLSFIEAASFLSVEQLDSLRSAVFDYMDDVASSFRVYLEHKKFLGAYA
jgi:hypothetical protein